MPNAISLSKTIQKYKHNRFVTGVCFESLAQLPQDSVSTPPARTRGDTRGRHAGQTTQRAHPDSIELSESLNYSFPHQRHPPAVHETCPSSIIASSATWNAASVMMALMSMHAMSDALPLTLLRAEGGGTQTQRNVHVHGANICLKS